MADEQQIVQRAVPVTVAELQKRLQGLPPDRPLALTQADSVQTIRAFANPLGIDVIWISLAAVPDGSVWGGVPMTESALALLVLPERIQAAVPDARGKIVLVPK